MNVWIVFEYCDPTNKIIGIYRNKNDAIKKHRESPTYRYIEEYTVE